MAGEMDIIDVRHEDVSGWHRFTSPQIPGLFVCVGPDQYEIGLGDIPAVIEMLIHGDTGKSVKVKRLRSYGRYLKANPRFESKRPSLLHYGVNELSA